MSAGNITKKGKPPTYHSDTRLRKEPSNLYYGFDHNTGSKLVKIDSLNGRIIREPQEGSRQGERSAKITNSGLSYYEYSRYQNSESLSELNKIGDGPIDEQGAQVSLSLKKEIFGEEGFRSCLRPKLDYAATRLEYVKQSIDALNRLKELNLIMREAIAHLKSPYDSESTMELFTLRYHQNLPREKNSIFGIAIWFVTLAVYISKDLSVREVRKNNSRYAKLIDQMNPMVNLLLSIKRKLKYMTKVTEKLLDKKRKILKNFSNCYEEAEDDVEYYRGSLNDNASEEKEEVKSETSTTGIVREVDSLEIFNRISPEGSIWIEFTQLELRDKRFYIKLFIRDAFKKFVRFNREQLQELNEKLTFNVHNGPCDRILGVSALGISYIESLKNMNKYLRKTGNILKDGLGPKNKIAFNYLETEIIFNNIKDIQVELYFLYKRFRLLEDMIYHVLCSAKVGYSFFIKDSVFKKVSIKEWRLKRLIQKFREFDNTLEVETATPESNFTNSPFIDLIMKYPLEFEGQIFTIVFKEKQKEKQ